MAERPDTVKSSIGEVSMLWASTATVDPVSGTTVADSDQITGGQNPHEAFGLTKELLDVIEAGRQTIMSREQVQSLPLRSYLDHTIVPVLIEGLKALARERPPNPCEYLAVYLLKNGDK
ncbi:hypothetical protein SpCBS45565_g05767 [Spizellomyces sp. 'palustris']|nr:hypothetical protein SpCBS45565_g05767 [Spizellomyces sp. 'palustris']